MQLPKAELHMHLEGALEPDLIFKCAERNKITLPYKSVEDLKSRYHFTDLPSFLDLYFENSKVLRTQEDLYDLAMSYFAKAHAQGVVHAEIFIELQSYYDRGISPHAVLEVVESACLKAEQEYYISSFILVCFLRDQSEQAARKELDFLESHRNDRIIGVGLASAEQGNPPKKFQNVFKKAYELGFHRVAHAGEDTDAEYIWQALNILHVERIDHGIKCFEDPRLVEYLQVNQVPLTVCPLSNIKLHTVADMQHHPLKKMFEAGLNVSIHSDDPAYFGGYIAENYYAAAQAFDWGTKELIKIAQNSIRSSFASPERKQALLDALDHFIVTHGQRS